MPPNWFRNLSHEPQGTPPPSEALELFAQFYDAKSFAEILEAHTKLCKLLSLPYGAPFSEFYPKFKKALKDHLPYKYKELWKILEKKAAKKVYASGSISQGKKVLVIGAGPCGLRAAIEAQLLGAETVIVERRAEFTRNNILKIWNFLIEDLKSLGAKKLYGSFCAGNINHIGIKELQLILTKVCLMLGIKIIIGTFQALEEPSEDGARKWRAKMATETEDLTNYEFDFLVVASGRKVAIEGFDRRSLDAKMSIAITVNFKNKGTSEEKAVREISGISRQYDQEFFKNLQNETGIDLENLVYYRGVTHYFVMTALRKSLLDKGVIKAIEERDSLLVPSNIDREALHKYAVEAAKFSTKHFSQELPHTEFEDDGRGQPDVAIFDFTNLYSARNSARVRVCRGAQLLMSIVGDSLLEPFWPDGTGCARGFLSSLDAVWMFRQWCLAKNNPMEILAERENIYKLLSQTTDGPNSNLKTNFKAYTLDPKTRYRSIPKTTEEMKDKILKLYESDDPEEYSFLSEKFTKQQYFEADKHQGLLNRIRNSLRQKNKPKMSFPKASRLVRAFRGRSRTAPSSTTADKTEAKEATDTPPVAIN